MQYEIDAWYTCFSVQLKAQLAILLRICLKIVGQMNQVFKLYIKECCLAGNNTLDPSPILFGKVLAFAFKQKI